MDALQLSFHARSWRALDLGVHHLDEPDAFVRRSSSCRCARYSPLQQHLDNRRACSRSAEAALFHGVRQLFLFERLPAVSMAVSRVASVRRLGDACLAQGPDIDHVLRLVPARWEARKAYRRHYAFVCYFKRLPADLLNGRSGGVVAVHDRAVGDGGNHGGNGPMWSSCHALSRRRQIKS